MSPRQRSRCARITTADNAAIARVIRQVSAEYGLTADKGYTVADPNLDELYQVYSQPGAAYWVVEQNGCVVGGGGVAPLSCSEPDICELQKMYFLPVIRGQGLAKKLALMALDHARDRVLNAAIWKQRLFYARRLRYTNV
ncbi:acetyltransferase [Salmonella enterica subsp. enterica serovar Madelia]|nr:acetyltransferase [Salmonella enterica subsp. enterica serovar Madelia]